MKTVKLLTMILWTVSFLTLPLLAKSVSYDDAKNVALNLIYSKTGKSVTIDDSVHDSGIDKELHIIRLKPKGWVIVSSDDRVEPIITWSAESSLGSSDSFPAGFVAWMDKAESQIKKAKKSDTDNDDELKEKWDRLKVSPDDYVAEVDNDGTLEGSVVKESFPATQWGQSEIFDIVKKVNPDIGGCIPTPTSTTASDGTYTDYVRLNGWMNNSGCYHHSKWYRATSRYGAKKYLFNIVPPVPIIVDRTATPGVKYYYFWKACNASYQCSAYSPPDIGWKKTSSGTGGPSLYASQGGYTWGVLLKSYKQGYNSIKFYRDGKFISAVNLNVYNHYKAEFKDYGAKAGIKHKYSAKACKLNSNGGGCTKLTYKEGWKKTSGIGGPSLYASQGGYYWGVLLKSSKQGYDYINFYRDGKYISTVNLNVYNYYKAEFEDYDAKAGVKHKYSAKACKLNSHGGGCTKLTYKFGWKK